MLLCHTLLPSMGFVSRPIHWSLRPHPTRVRWLARSLVSLSHAILLSRGLPADPFVDHCAPIPLGLVGWPVGWPATPFYLPGVRQQIHSSITAPSYLLRGSSADPFVNHCALIPSGVRWLVSHALTHFRVHIWCSFFTGSTAGVPVFIVMGSTLSWTFPCGLHTLVDLSSWAPHSRGPFLMGSTSCGPTHGFRISWIYLHGFHILWTHLPKAPHIVARLSWVLHLADLYSWVPHIVDLSSWVLNLADPFSWVPHIMDLSSGVPHPVDLSSWVPHLVDLSL